MKKSVRNIQVAALSRLAIAFSLAALAPGSMAAGPAKAAARPIAASSPIHPLDELTAAEIRTVTDILHKSGRVADGVYFPTFTLLPPSKADVRAWKPGTPLIRRAQVVIQSGQTLTRAIVDINSRSVQDWQPITGVFPRNPSYTFAMSDIFRKDARVIEAARKRGVTDMSKVSCYPLSPGPIDTPALRGKWVAFATCLVESGSPSFGEQLEGVLLVVDIAEKKLLDVVDTGAVPFWPGKYGLTPKSYPHLRGPAKPIIISSPQGSNIKMSGHEVSWDNWRFHLRFDQREGTVVSLLRYVDKGRERPIVYDMHASEMFVPYMSPERTWSWRAYMDIGEYYYGESATVLTPGSDCPANAIFLSPLVANDVGVPVIKRNAVCIFERPTGDAVWRHGLEKQSRPNVELVVRMAPVIGNYDYVVDYVLDRAGNIDIRAGAMGIDAVKAVATRKLTDPTAAADTKYGTLIAPGIVATNHDHYINFRVDLDIDGEQNRAVFDMTAPSMLPEGGFRRSLWTVKSKTVDKAGPLPFPEGTGALRIESSTAKNAMGNPTSFQVYGGHQVSSLLSPDDPIQQRASWSANPVWLSLYSPDQRYASGEFPNLAEGEDKGLAGWTKPRQNIEDKDLVLWLNLAFRHIPRAEDWPAMPALWHTVRLRPFNFFDGSPAMDVPEAVSTVTRKPRK